MRLPKSVLRISLLGTGIGGLVLLREAFGVSGRQYHGTEKMLGRTVIVTGANTGIGKETAKELARRGARVILACRDYDKGEKARAEIVLETANRNIEVRELDLASLQSVRVFARTIKKNEARLDVLVNNAAVMRCPRTLTQDGFETQLGVNHLGHFLLTCLLLPELRKSEPSRVVVLTSDAHRRGNINFADLNSAEDYGPGKAYEQSKLANVLFVRELSKRVEATDVTVNGVNPGLVRTDLVRHMGFAKSYISYYIVKPLLHLVMRAPTQGAQTVVYAAVDPGLRGVSGKFFKDVAEEETAPQAQSDEDAKRLWAISARWTRLDSDEERECFGK